jgi:hypothetical protein
VLPRGARMGALGAPPAYRLRHGRLHGPSRARDRRATCGWPARPRTCAAQSVHQLDTGRTTRARRAAESGAGASARREGANLPPHGARHPGTNVPRCDPRRTSLRAPRRICGVTCDPSPARNRGADGVGAGPRDRADPCITAGHAIWRERRSAAPAAAPAATPTPTTAPAATLAEAEPRRRRYQLAGVVERSADVGDDSQHR